MLSPKRAQPLAPSTVDEAQALDKVVVAGTTAGLSGNDVILLDVVGAPEPALLRVAAAQVDATAGVTNVLLQQGATAQSRAAPEAAPPDVTAAIDTLLDGGLAKRPAPVPAAPSDLRRNVADRLLAAVGRHAAAAVRPAAGGGSDALQGARRHRARLPHRRPGVGPARQGSPVRCPGAAEGALRRARPARRDRGLADRRHARADAEHHRPGLRGRAGGRARRPRGGRGGRCSTAHARRAAAADRRVLDRGGRPGRRGRLHRRGTQSPGDHRADVAAAVEAGRSRGPRRARPLDRGRGARRALHGDRRRLCARAGGDGEARRAERRRGAPAR